METIKALKTGFIQRLFISSGFYLGFIMFIVLEFVLISKKSLQLNHYILYQILLLIVLILFSIICFNKAKFYINEIELNDKFIVLNVLKFDKEFSQIKIYYANLSLYLKRSLAERYPTYILEFKSKNNLISIKQYQIGYWGKANLFKAFELINDAKKNAVNV